MGVKGSYVERLNIRHMQGNDMVFITIDDGRSVYSTWISAEEAVAIGDVGKMARASKEEKKRASKG